MGAFQYEQFQDASTSIRVLELLPRKHDEQISCRLRNVSLERDHVCLSYMWGMGNPSHPILINGQVVMVRDNLRAFLEAATRGNSQQGVSLWIDAVCIDQSNVEERNKQVSLMGKIYSQASHVIVWLGEGESAVEEALDWAWMITESPTLETVSVEDDVTGEHTDESGNPDHLYWDAFDTIASLPYWSRMWIVQEILLAKEITLWYGSRKLSYWYWDSLCGFINNKPGPKGTSQYIGNSKVIRSPCGYLTRKHFQKTDPNFPRTDTILGFQLAFTNFPQQRCSERRDNVYALISMDPETRDFPVDYSQDAEFLLPQIYDCGCSLMDMEWFGLELIRRLELRNDKIFELTKDYFTGRNWEIAIHEAAIITGTAEHGGETCWHADWSCFIESPKRNRDKLVTEDVALTAPETVSETSTVFNMQEGDLLVRPRWLNVFILYRNSNTSGQEQIGRQRFTPKAYLDIRPKEEAERLGDTLANYHCVGAFSCHPRHTKLLSCTGDLDKLRAHPEPLLLQHFGRNELILEFQKTRLRASRAKAFMEIGWPCLLRIWELAYTGLLQWRGFESAQGEPAHKVPIGTWREEMQKVANGD